MRRAAHITRWVLLHLALLPVTLLSLIYSALGAEIGPDEALDVIFAIALGVGLAWMAAQGI